MSKNNHLSYAEVILIAIVLGTAGKMIVPRFTAASGEEAKISELVDGIEVMRTQLDLYCVQHGDVLPPTDSFASFETAMTTENGQHGPYIEEIPTNSFNGLKTIRFDGEPAGAGRAGWRLDTKTGLFQADNDAACAAL